MNVLIRALLTDPEAFRHHWRLSLVDSQKKFFVVFSAMLTLATKAAREEERWFDDLLGAEDDDSWFGFTEIVWSSLGLGSEAEDDALLAFLFPEHPVAIAPSVASALLQHLVNIGVVVEESAWRDLLGEVVQKP